MKISSTQKNAKAWAKSLNKLTQSSPGQIQVSYIGDDGVKKVGYCNLLDLEITFDKENMTLLTFISKSIERIYILESKVEKLEKNHSRVDKFIKGLGGKIK